MAMPEFLDQDRFYLNLDNNQIEWMYHNPDSVTQGQFVTNVFDISLLEAALTDALDAEDAFDHIGSACRQYLADKGTEFYGEAWRRMETAVPFAVGCSFTTLEQLQLAFQAKDLINQYCQAEFGSDADFADLRQIGIGYTTITDAEHDIQAYANLIDHRIEIQINWVVAQYYQYESLADMVANGLPDLDFDSLTYLPEWLVKNHVRNVDLDRIATSLTLFMKSYQPEAYEEIMEPGDTDADMISRMKADLRDPVVIPEVITEIDEIVKNGDLTEKEKYECRSIMTGLYHLYAEDMYVPVYDREADILFEAVEKMGLQDVAISLGDEGISVKSQDGHWQGMGIYTHLSELLPVEKLRQLRDEHFDCFIDLRDIAYHYGVMLGYDIDPLPVARLDFLGANGKVGERIEYFTEADFLNAVHEELDAGVPLAVVLYRDPCGKRISRDFLNDVSTLPKGLTEEEVSYMIPAKSIRERGETR